MCLGIPMKIREIEGLSAICWRSGIKREVNLFLLQDQDIHPGDYVLVHVGYAIQKLNPEESQQSNQLFDAMVKDNA